MKLIEKPIINFQESSFFSAMRTKGDYVKVLMHCARQLLLPDDELAGPSIGKLRLVVDKMSRVFIYKTDKYFTVSFPFKATTQDGIIVELSTYTGKKLDFMSISAVLAILESSEFNSNMSLIDYYIEPGSIDSAGIVLLEEIFLSEPGYVRYDRDVLRSNGKLHPENHLDYNYSQYSTFKYGLPHVIDRLYFENLHDINTDCSFVTD